MQAETEHRIKVSLSSWAFHHLGNAARQSGRSIEDEAADRLERSVQNRRSSDRMDEFLRLAQEP